MHDKRPASCRVFFCRWIADPDTANLPRPDRAGYVIDPVLDFLTRTDLDTGEDTLIPAIQVWFMEEVTEEAVMRDHPLRGYMALQARKGVATLIRIGSNKGFVVLPPGVEGDGWYTAPTKELPA